MVGDQTGATHRLGDRVTVRLVEAAPIAGALRFELLTEGRYNKDGRPPARATRKRSAGGQNRRAVRETGRKRRR
jgi:ribonuclease R